MAQVIYNDNDNVIELAGVRNGTTGDYLDAAAVAVTLTDSAGAEVSGETWPLSMAYVAGSNGRYRATLADTLSLTAGQRYTATITADGGAGLFGKFVMDLVCQSRTQ